MYINNKQNELKNGLNILYSDNHEKLGTCIISNISPKDFVIGKNIPNYVTNKLTDIQVNNAVFLSGGFSIEPKYRNRGIGEKFINLIFEHSDFNTLLFYVNDLKALKFWKRIGSVVLLEKNNLYLMSLTKNLNETKLITKHPEIQKLRNYKGGDLDIDYLDVPFDIGPYIPKNISGNLIIRNVENLKSLPEGLTCKELFIIDCPNFTTIPESLNCKYLGIYSCLKFTTLAENLNCESLRLWNLPNLTAIPIDIKLNFLAVGACRNIKYQMLKKLKNVKSIEFNGSSIRNLNEMKLKTLLLESFSLYEIKVIVKTRKESESKLTTVYDKIRAVPYVVIAHPIKDPGISSRSDSTYEYAQVNLKFLVRGNYEDELQKIKDLCLHGMPETKEFKVKGLVAFVPRHRTLKKLK